MVNDLSGQSETTIKFTPLLDSIKNSMDSVYRQDIIEFLRKPVAIRQGTISATNTPGQVIEWLELYRQTLDLPVYTEKLKGFFLFSSNYCHSTSNQQ